MNILAIDLGKFQSQACFFDGEDASHRFEKVATTPAALHDLFLANQGKVDRLVIEVCHSAGWVVDLAGAMGVADVQVANANHEAWRWRNVKNKSDKQDALKLARLSAMNQLPTVHVPAKAVRQWRGLIHYRHTLVERRTAIRNAVHAILGSAGEADVKDFGKASIVRLGGLARELPACGPEELWRGQLHCELTALEEVGKLIDGVEKKLDEVAARDDRVELLQSIPGVGPRLAEMVVALIDDPRRFKNARQVGAYAGLTPKRYQSGACDRSGRISRAGCGRLRKVLVQVAWGMLRHNGHGKGIFERLCKGQRTRRKQAAVALARRILTWCWAMLRDGRRWDPGKLVAARPMTKAA
jgi:transposase